MGDKCEETWVTLSQSGNVAVYEGAIVSGECCDFEITITSDEHIPLFAWAKLNALSCHGLAQVDLKVGAKTDVSPIVHLAHMKLASVLEGLDPLRKTTLAGHINLTRTAHVQRRMGANHVVGVSPNLQLRMGIRRVGETVMPEKLMFHRAVKTLDLPLRLRVAYPAVDRQNIQVHQPFLKARIPSPKPGKLRAVVRQHRLRQPVFTKGRLENRDDHLSRRVGGGYAQGKAAVIVNDVQGITVLAILRQELAFEVGLPKLIAPLPLKAPIRLSLARLLQVNAAVAVQNRVDRASAGDPLFARLLQHDLDLARSPAGMLRTNRENLALNRLRRPRRDPPGLTATVLEFFAVLGAPHPLVAGFTAFPF